MGLAYIDKVCKHEPKQKWRYIKAKHILFMSLHEDWYLTVPVNPALHSIFFVRCSNYATSYINWNGCDTYPPGSKMLTIQTIEIANASNRFECNVMWDLAHQLQCAIRHLSYYRWFSGSEYSTVTLFCFLAGCIIFQLRDAMTWRSWILNSKKHERWMNCKSIHNQWLCWMFDVEHLKKNCGSARERRREKSELSTILCVEGIVVERTLSLGSYKSDLKRKRK